MKLTINESECLNEKIQLIHIDNNTIVTVPLIKRALVMARGNKDYAKFFIDKWYITVAFQKDNSVTFSHNIRSNEFQRELNVMERQGYDIDKYSYFICKWINKIKNNPYFKNLF
jgi:hypothetical protein